MRENIIMIGSVTHALKARDVLSAHGIPSRIIKTPKELNTCGCGYSIAVRKDVKVIEKILTDAGVTILR